MTTNIRRIPNIAFGGDLIGREAELAFLHDLAGVPSDRLITITGPGGIGKTHVAHQFALEQHHLGTMNVIFVPLATILSDAFMLPAIAQSLDVPDHSSLPLPAAIAQALGDQPTLLVLDNLEHLPGAAEIVAGLLQQSRALTVLATSRLRLRLRAERVLQLAPLALPLTFEPDRLADFATHSGIKLFVERVRRLRPAFALTPANAAVILEICRRLEGLPLGIELIASQANALSVRDMLARMDTQMASLSAPMLDVPQRQWTMQASIAWSYALLPESARTGLCQLAVFPGSFDSRAALAVADVDTETLEMLLDHHLVRQSAPSEDAYRFMMLESIKQFGIGKLRASGAEAAVRDRHVTYICELAESLEQRIHTEAERQTANILDAHIDDIYAVLEWTLTHRDLDHAVRLLVTLEHYWIIRVHWSTSLQWVQRIVASVDEFGGVDDELLARLFTTAGMIAYHAERWAESDRFFERAVLIARATGDRGLLAYACVKRVPTLLELDDREGAEQYQQEAMLLAEQIGTPNYLKMAYAQRGAIALFRGDFEQATAAFQRSLAAARLLGFPGAVANLLHYLGYTLMFQGDYDGGRAALLSARSSQSHERTTEYYATICGLARLELLAGHAPDATIWLIEYLEGRSARGERGRTIDGLLEMGRLALLNGHAEQAAEFFGAANMDVATMETVPLFGPLWILGLDSARAALGDAAFTSAYRRGQMSSIPEAVDQALGYAANLVQQERAEQANMRRQRFACGKSFSLTAREIEVLACLVEAKSDREIGEALFISPQTASKHVKNILKKLSAPSRMAAVMTAMRSGMFSPAAILPASDRETGPSRV